jgi:hypothetical protein
MLDGVVKRIVVSEVRRNAVVDRRYLSLWAALVGVAGSFFRDSIEGAQLGCSGALRLI